MTNPPPPSKKPLVIAGLLALAGVICAAVGLLLLAGAFLRDAGVTGRGLFKRVASAAGQPVSPGFRGGKPQGLYFMTRYWSFTGTLEKAAWYFAPDGRVYANLSTGFSDEELAAHDGSQGMMNVDGDTMTVTWADGKTTSSKIERDDEAFTWDMGIFTPVEPFDDQELLVGQWEGGESLTTGGNHASMSKTLALRSDGTFTWNSVSFLKGETDRSVLSAGAEGGTSGRWELDGHALVLTADDGVVYRAIAFPYDDPDTPVDPDRFFLGGIMYKKQDA